MLENTRVTKLPNGIVVATQEVHGLRSASVGIYLDIGSREERLNKNGLAHFFEHMVFKGTHKYSALELVRCLEATGGQINAFTTKEQTCFYAKVIDREASKALDILLEMTLQAKLDKEEIEKEREVILEEIRGTLDNPDDYIYDLFYSAIFKGKSLGAPIAGTVSTMRKMGQKALLEHQNAVRNEVPFFVLAVGKIKHSEVVKLVNKQISSSGLKQKRKRLLPNRPSAFPKPASVVMKREIQQATALIGCPGYSMNDPKRLPLILLNCVFGEGMSSRLFQKVREEKGLVYSIYSSPEFFTNSGVFTISFGTEAKNLRDCIKTISEVIREIKQKGFTSDELNFAKNSIEGNILMGLESTQTRMAYMSRQIMYGKAHENLEHFLHQIQKVSLKQMNALIPSLFNSSRWASASIVPKGSQGIQAKWLEF